jgi:hypothetical protein
MQHTNNFYLKQKNMKPSLTTLLIFITTLLYAKEYDASVLDYQCNITVSSNQLTETYKYRLKIHNAAGTRFAEVAIPYNKGNPAREINARIRSMDGRKIRELKRKDIRKVSYVSSGSLYEDDFISHFDMIHNEYPYILEYEYKITSDNYLSIAHWTPAVYNNIPTLNATLTINFKEITNHRRFIKGDVEFKQFNDDNILVHHFSSSYQPMDRETFAPPLSESLASVTILPDNFYYLMNGQSNSWQSLGKWHAELNRGKDILPADESQKIHLLTQDLRSDIDKIKALYYYLQDNHRYINVSIDMGGLSPYPAEYVCKNRYGDCKALTIFMKAILKEAGIKSHYTLVNSGSNASKVDPLIIWSGQFNHIILCIPQVTDTLWLECTSQTSPFNYLGTFTQNRKVLVVNEENSHLAHTPAMSLSDVKEVYKHTITLNEDKLVHIATNATVKGQLFETLNSVDNLVRDSEKEEIMDWIGLLHGLDLKDIQIERLSRDSASVNFYLEGKVNNLVDYFGKRMIIRPLKNYAPILEEPSQRTQAVRLNLPRHSVDTFNIISHKAIDDISGEKSIEITTQFGLYKRSISHQDKHIQIIRTFQLHAGEYNLDEYTEFYEFMKSVGHYNDTSILVTLKQ